MLHSWHCSSQVCVRMMGCSTQYINIYSGLQQGGTFSSLFYNIYVDNLMKQLSSEKLSCTIAEIYYGTIFYAHDIVLLGASKRKMQKKIEIFYN